MRYVLRIGCILLIVAAAFLVKHRMSERTAETASAATNQLAATEASTPATIRATADASAAETPALDHNQPVVSAPPTDDWAELVEAARSVEESDAAKSSRLLTLFPALPVEGKNEIAPDLAALTPNEAYASLSKLLTDPQASDEVLMVLFTDLLDRPDSIRLPLLLELARNAEHPKAEDARDMLTVELGEDVGTDWDAWAKKISEWLAGHPE
jgi:hypothetical protein